MSVRNGIFKNCKICSKEFYVPKSRLRIKFCSYDCDYQNRKSAYAGAKNPFWGKSHSEEFKKKVSGKRHHKWAGGKYRTPEGYVYVLAKTHPRANYYGYVYEHILKMEKKIGRFIKLPEVIHHINGIKHDNRLKNLMLFRNNSDHMQFHSLKDFAGVTNVH